MTTSTAAIVDEQLTAPVVGVDVGGTKIAAALVSADGGLLGPVAEAPTPAREGAQAVLDAIASSVTTLIDTGAPAARRVRLAPVAVGIGSAGVIDAGRGVVASATDTITGWPGTDIAGGVARRLLAAGVASQDLLVHVDNDVNAYAAGEAWIGAGAGAGSVLVVAVGTGVGGAVVLDGHVHHGAHFLAGEMGHMPSGTAGSEPCTCGRSGHLEAIAAGPQIARRYREATGAVDVTGAHQVERLADAGDAAAVVTVLDPERVIVSGGLARSGDLWWGPLRETVRAEVVGLVADDLELVPAALGTTAPIVGAAHQARLRLLSRRAAGL